MVIILIFWKFAWIKITFSNFPGVSFFPFSLIISKQTSFFLMLQENLERSKSSQSPEILASTERASYQFAEGVCLGRTPDHMPGWRARHLKVLLFLKSDYRIFKSPN